nr:hypothetical protein [Tanacetum cinerariifolium]
MFIANIHEVLHVIDDKSGPTYDTEPLELGLSILDRQSDKKPDRTRPTRPNVFQSGPRSMLFVTFGPRSGQFDLVRFGLTKNPMIMPFRTRPKIEQDQTEPDRTDPDRTVPFQSSPRSGFLDQFGFASNADDNDEDEHVELANLIANLKLDIDENKKIQKQLKKTNAILTHELNESKPLLLSQMTLGKDAEVLFIKKRLGLRST